MSSRIYGVCVTATWTCDDCGEEFDVDYDSIEAFQRDHTQQGPDHDDHGYCEPPEDDDDECRCTGSCDPESCSCCSDANCECCQDDDDDDECDCEYCQPNAREPEAPTAAPVVARSDGTVTGIAPGTSSVYGTLR